MKLKLSLLLTLLCFSFTTHSQETIKTMFYNLLEFPNALPNNRTEILESILETYNPDIFMVCEMQNEGGAQLLLDESLNANGYFYAQAPFVSNQSSSSNLQQMLYYRANMFTLGNVNVIQTSVRDINQYSLKVNTVDGTTDPLILEIFVAHLKSSQGSANQNLRLEMVTQFTDALETIPEDSFVLLAGDLNIYTASEPAYTALLDPNNAIPLVDPINQSGSWHNNIDYQDIHTQSTRESSGPFGAGAGGGLDDRFDFILMSENMETDPKFRYIENSYAAYGNNGNCYNKSINDPNCVGNYSESLRNDLYNMSDHLPVVMDFETNKELLLSTNTITSIKPNIWLEATQINEALTVHNSIPSTPINIEVYSVLGELVAKSYNNTNTINTLMLNHINSGIYIVKVTSDKSVFTQKIIKTFE